MSDEAALATWLHGNLLPLAFLWGLLGVFQIQRNRSEDYLTNAGSWSGSLMLGVALLNLAVPWLLRPFGTPAELPEVYLILLALNLLMAGLMLFAIGVAIRLLMVWFRQPRRPPRRLGRAR
ncbi:MAG TPA: hypothetical protein VEI97_13180 [bacterium]|nr:hypothetical protein [bacterium]